MVNKQKNEICNYTSLIFKIIWSECGQKLSLPVCSLMVYMLYIILYYFTYSFLAVLYTVFKLFLFYSSDEVF